MGTIKLSQITHASIIQLPRIVSTYISYVNVFLPVLLKGQLNMITYLQKLSPFEDGDDMHVPSCLQGLGEQETKPESGKIRNVSDLSSCQAEKDKTNDTKSDRRPCFVFVSF